MLKRFFSCLPQYLAPQRALTHLAGWLSSRRAVWFKTWQIQTLIKRYGANLEEAASPHFEDYPTFNAFFTRHLKPGIRPLARDPLAILSPADGCLSQIGKIEEDRLLQAKGFDYRLSDLLGGNAKLAEAFMGGQFATIYLSPKDYHRVHMPCSGLLRQTCFIPGRLFSVSTHTAAHIPRLFARNERLVTLFDTDCGPMIVILVGAMLVASIHTVWAGAIRADTIQTQDFPDSGAGAIRLERGVEMGHFEMGSTAIVLFPPQSVQWAPSLQAESLVQMGTALGLRL